MHLAVDFSPFSLLTRDITWQFHQAFSLDIYINYEYNEQAI